MLVDGFVIHNKMSSQIVLFYDVPFGAIETVVDE